MHFYFQKNRCWFCITICIGSTHFEVFWKIWHRFCLMFFQLKTIIFLNDVEKSTLHQTIYSSKCKLFFCSYVFFIQKSTKSSWKFAFMLKLFTVLCTVAESWPLMLSCTLAVQVPCRHCASTVQLLCRHRAGTVQAPCQHCTELKPKIGHSVADRHGKQKHVLSHWSATRCPALGFSCVPRAMVDCPCKHCAITVHAPCRHCASAVQAVCWHRARNRVADRHSEQLLRGTIW